MRYQIKVNGKPLMEVLYISDAEWFVRERVSLGQKVEVLDTQTGETKQITLEQVMRDMRAESNQKSLPN